MALHGLLGLETMCQMQMLNLELDQTAHFLLSVHSLEQVQQLRVMQLLLS
jgi:hypothetical protein